MWLWLSRSRFLAVALVPFIFDAHDEKQQWRSLVSVIQLLAGAATGLGIPTGGGLIYHPDGSLECLRVPAHEFSFERDKVLTALLYPVPTAAR